MFLSDNYCCSIEPTYYASIVFASGTKYPTVCLVCGYIGVPGCAEYFVIECNKGYRARYFVFVNLYFVLFW